MTPINPLRYIPASQPFSVLTVSEDGEHCAETVIAWLMHEDLGVTPVTPDFGCAMGVFVPTAANLLHDLNAGAYWTHDGLCFTNLDDAKCHAVSEIGKEYAAASP